MTDCQREIARDGRIDTLLRAVCKEVGLREVTYLDKGTFSYVMEASLGTSTSRVAIKISASFDKDAVCLPVHVLREVQALTHLRHPNVIALKSLHFLQGVAAMVFPRYECNLYYYVGTRRPLTLHVIRQLFKGVVAGVAAAHARGLMHRDLKPSNILLDRDLGVVVADWGMCRTAADCNAKDFLTELVITLWYAPPEVVCRRNNYGLSADVWSLAIMLLEMLNGGSIFTNSERRYFMEDIFKLCGNTSLSTQESTWIDGIMPARYPRLATFPKYDPSIQGLLHKRPDVLRSATCMDLLSKMLRYVPNERLTAAEILQHPFLLEEPPAGESGQRPHTSRPKFAVVSGLASRTVVPPSYKHVPLRFHQKYVLPVIYQVGWHPVCAREDVLFLLSHAVFHYKASFQPYLTAMQMSWEVFHTYKGSPENVKRFMYACVSVAYATMGPASLLETRRNTLRPDTADEGLKLFGIDNVRALAALENDVLEKVRGQVPLDSPIYQPLMTLEPRACSQRVAMLLLSCPDFLASHNMTILTVRDLCTGFEAHPLRQVCADFITDCKCDL
jgi:serine/threonine protein kinase